MSFVYKYTTRSIHLHIHFSEFRALGLTCLGITTVLISVNFRVIK
nr:MAG TPA: hypothetical protein [Caudoviricetes sp.]